MAFFALSQSLSALVVGTYNIRYDTKEDVIEQNEWSRRAPVIAKLIRFHGFDVLATQEGLPKQMKQLNALLPDHNLVSHGRKDGKDAGEHMGIFYKKEMFELLDSGMFWLSENPDQPGQGWDADLPRTCTWAKLKHKKTAKVTFFFCLHLDHRGKESRVESSKLVLEKIQEIAGENRVVLAGDFNASQDSEPCVILKASEILEDAIDVAEFTYVSTGTFNRFDPDYSSPHRIDHVFVRKGMKVRRYGVLTDTYRIPLDSNEAEGSVAAGNWKAKLPSDHFPVLVELED